jgi:transposase
MAKAFQMRNHHSQSSTLEVTEGERSEPQGTGRVLAAPEPEVPEKATRRKFSAEYKLRILRLADSCTDPGSLGRLLRKEGLYSSNLTTWRRQRANGVLQGLRPAKRGRKASEANPLLPELVKLRKENEHLEKRLKRAELIIEVQKKVSQMLGLEPSEESEQS